jgi:hypothetical protein
MSAPIKSDDLISGQADPIFYAFNNLLFMAQIRAQMENRRFRSNHNMVKVRFWMSKRS